LDAFAHKSEGVTFLLDDLERFMAMNIFGFSEVGSLHPLSINHF